MDEDLVIGVVVSEKLSGIEVSMATGSACTTGNGDGIFELEELSAGESEDGTDVDSPFQDHQPEDFFSSVAVGPPFQNYINQKSNSKAYPKGEGTFVACSTLHSE